jgi:hypothetical protein
MLVFPAFDFGPAEELPAYDPARMKEQGKPSGQNLTFGTLPMTLDSVQRGGGR